MRKIWIVISVIVILLMFQGCSIEVTEYTEAKAPNWTSDGKIIFIEDYNYVKDRHSLFGTSGNIEGSYEILTLCEVNSDGTVYEEITEVARSENHAISIAINSTSSAGDWVTFDLRTEDESVHRICTIRKDGSNFNNTGIEGQHPDFSPDASRIVYQKPNQGIWIMDRDGGNDHRIISDTDASYPAYSRNGQKVCYVSDSLYVTDTSGAFLNAFRNYIDMPDWGTLDTNAICGSNGHFILIIDTGTGDIDSLTQISDLGWGWGVKWSPNENYFIASDGAWFVINRDGSNKWYLQP